jgi:hypothetical protein
LSKIYFSKGGFLLGTTDLTALEFRVSLGNVQISIMETYTHPLIAKNCNHFSDDVCQWLMEAQSLGGSTIWCKQVTFATVCSQRVFQSQ